MLGEPFDPRSDLAITEHFRPHWTQAGAVVFITFRCADSIPKEVIKLWDRQEHEWLRIRGKNSKLHWSKSINLLSEFERNQFHQEFSRCREDCLDECHGRCVLRRPELSEIVANALLHFDGNRYRMGDFVVMPNHVHLLAMFSTPEQMSKACKSWLHFTAVQINKRLGEEGKFWQQEPFDHLVRSADQYDYLRAYIANNPLKASLSSSEYVYRRLDA